MKDNLAGIVMIAYVFFLAIGFAFFRGHEIGLMESQGTKKSYQFKNVKPAFMVERDEK